MQEETVGEKPIPDLTTEGKNCVARNMDFTCEINWPEASLYFSITASGRGSSY